MKNFEVRKLSNISDARFWKLENDQKNYLGTFRTKKLAPKFVSIKPWLPNKNMKYERVYYFKNETIFFILLF